MTNEHLAIRTVSLEMQIVELDERLDTALDPLLSDIVIINGVCGEPNQGCNNVAGCGRTGGSGS